MPDNPERKFVLTLTEKPDGGIGVVAEFDPEVRRDDKSMFATLAFALLEGISNGEAKLNGR